MYLPCPPRLDETPDGFQWFAWRSPTLAELTTFLNLNEVIMPWATTDDPLKPQISPLPKNSTPVRCALCIGVGGRIARLLSVDNGRAIDGMLKRYDGGLVYQKHS